MSRLYSNENFPFPVVAALRRLGHDVLTTPEAGFSGNAMRDEDVLAFAAREQRTLLTLNRRHFIRLHGLTQSHAGIVVCHFDPDFEQMAKRFDDELRAAEPLAGKLIHVRRTATG